MRDVVALVLVVLNVALALTALVLWRKSRADGVRTGRGAVAAAPEPVPPRLRDLIESQGVIEADLAALARRVGDLDKHWERRWGTLARQGRRDAAALAAEASADGAGSDPDPAQLTFPNVTPGAPAARQPLRPVRFGGGRA